MRQPDDGMGSTPELGGEPRQAVCCPTQRQLARKELTQNPTRCAGGGKPMSPELVLFVGLQGAGKSSFYQARFADTHDLVSKDRFPNNRNPSRRQRQLIEEALAAGRSVVVDNTNPTVEERAELIALARSFGAAVIGYYFESRLPDCLERNRQRQGQA